MRIKKNKKSHQLIADKCFRISLGYMPKIAYALSKPFFGDMFAGGVIETEADFIIGNRSFRADVAIITNWAVLLIEAHRYKKGESILGYSHRRICIARLSSKCKRLSPRAIYSLIFTDTADATGNEPCLTIGSETDYGPDWPAMVTKIVNVTKTQKTQAQQDICNDLLATDLRKMRTPSIINAFKETLEMREGDVIKNMLERYEKAIVRKHKKQWLEEGRAQTYSQILKSGKMSLSELAGALNKSKEDILRSINAHEPAMAR